jgi:RNA polymerase sigma-70 factor (ECF subfamily)
MITATSTHMLLGLKDRDNGDVWSQFCTRYQPLILSFARKVGLHEQDVQDVAQEALLAFASSFQQGKYDRDKGQLRQWLLGIAHHKIRDLQRSRGREFAMGKNTENTGLLSAIPDDRTMSDLWEAEWQRAIIRQCMDQIRKEFEPATLRAFELFVIEEQPAEEVGRQLGMTANAVFKAKRRILTRIREDFEYLQKNW